MRSPIRAQARVEEAALPVARPLSLRVLRLAWALDLPWGGAGGATAVPIAVVDRSEAQARTRPVVDSQVARGAMAALLTIVRFVLTNRRGLGKSKL
jgi:hypothetical protein